MALDMTDVDLLPILAAALAQVLLGAAWFGAFAKPWAARAFPGKTKAEIQAGPKWPYGVAVVGALLTAYALDVLMAATGATTLASALTLAFLAWVGLVGVAFAVTYAFQGRPFGLLAIDAGHHLARLLVAAVVLVLLA